MALADATKQVLALQAGARQQSFQAGALLLRIKRTNEYKEGHKYKSFGTYVEGELAPQGMSRVWVYHLMAVATYFTEQEAMASGIPALYLIFEIKLAIFPTVEPQALLSGTYSFKDADGEEHVLDFQKDHREDTLKAFLAAHHAQPAPHELHSQEGPVIEKVLKQQKATLDSPLNYSVAEHTHNGAMRVALHIDAADGMYRDLFEELNDKV